MTENKVWTAKHRESYKLKLLRGLETDGPEKEGYWEKTNALGLFDLFLIYGAMDLCKASHEKHESDLNDGKRVFDWIVGGLKRSISARRNDDKNNIWVAMANIYLNTSGVRNFIEYLKPLDLAKDMGHFNTDAFCEKVRKWNEKLLLVKGIEALNKTENKGRRSW
jgi:hypothetical protein